MGFKHAGQNEDLLKDLCLEVRFGSKVGIVGKNGSGKSTLLEIIANRRQPNGGRPEYWQHRGLRLVYIAQHHEEQLGEFMDCTPCEYVQCRFRKGYGSESRPAHIVDTIATYTKKEEQRLKDLAKR